MHLMDAQGVHVREDIAGPNLALSEGVVHGGVEEVGGGDEGEGVRARVGEGNHAAVHADFAVSDAFEEFEELGLGDLATSSFEFSKRS